MLTRQLRTIGLLVLIGLPYFAELAIATDVPALFRQSQPIPATSPSPNPSVSPNAPNTSEPQLSIPMLEQSVYEQVNRHRATLGLSPLKLDGRISDRARAYSLDMAQRRLPFGHSDFRRRVLVMNRIVPSRRISENVAYIFTHKDTAKRAVEGWLKSPRHRPILEGREYRITGIGIAQGERGAFYITQVYIRPR